MNLIECFVSKIIIPPVEVKGKWWVNVEYQSWGTKGTCDVMFDNKQDADKFKTGDSFLS